MRGKRIFKIVLVWMQLFVFGSGCANSQAKSILTKEINYRQEVRKFVIDLSTYAKDYKKPLHIKWI